MSGVDDVHFILRHAMTGAVFAIFAIAGFALVDPTEFAKWLDNAPVVDGDWFAAGAALAILVFPMIGITIQGAHYCLYTVFWADWFEDDARKYVAKKVRTAVLECEKIGASNDIPVDWKSIREAPLDAFFVWLYHDRATPHMIEWARRRRSYYYLGRNWVSAAVAGIISGALIASVRAEPALIAVAAIPIGITWALGASMAAGRMRRDADAMEAIWAASQVDPHFRNCLATLLPREDLGSKAHPADPPLKADPLPVAPVHDEAVGSAPRKRKTPARVPRTGASAPLETATR